MCVKDVIPELIRKLAMVIRVTILALLLVSWSGGCESETLSFDYSDNFLAYAQTVARLNQTQETADGSSVRGSKASSEAQLTALLCKTDGRELDFRVFSPVYIVSGPNHCFTLFYSSRESCQNAAAVLSGTAGIIYAEPDSEVYAAGAQDSSDEPSVRTFYSWGASQMNYGCYIDYTDAWGNGSASIAVVDSGVFPHPLIRGKLLQSGFDYVDADSDSLNDLFGHGTNVAGIIADCTIDEPVYIYPIRVLSNNGSGKMSNIVNAVREAQTREVTVINLSLESFMMSAALDDAILEAVSSGITVVVAAGNSSCDTAEVCPAHLTDMGVIVVGAAEGNDGSYTKASYSNYGSSVDIYAFGTDITCCSRSGGFSVESGTSMAAPHISALCALMHLIHPDLAPEQTEERLRLAASGGGAVVVPDSLLMIPVTEGLFLSSVRMSVRDCLSLPTAAYPQSACEAITYCSSNERVAACESGSLRAMEAGGAIITVSCKGFDDVCFPVTVDDDPDPAFMLPGTPERIEDEAFFGVSSVTWAVIPDSVHSLGNRVFEDCMSLRRISIPSSVLNIGENTFSQAVILCQFDSMIYQYAAAYGLQYIASN